MTDTLREAVERLLEKWEAKSRKPTFDEFDRLVCDAYESRASDLRAVLAAHPAPEPGRRTYGLPGCSDEPDTADEPVCCHTTHGGPINRDECHRCRVESPVPSSAPEDEQEELAQIVEYAHRTGPVSVGEPSMARESADLIIAAGWRSPTEVAALVADAERRTRGQVTGEIERDILALRVDSSGPQMVRYNCAAIARAATKAVSDA